MSMEVCQVQSCPKCVKQVHFRWNYVIVRVRPVWKQPPLVGFEAGDAQHSPCSEAGAWSYQFFQLWGTKNPFFGSDNCHVSQWQWWRLSTWCMFGTEPFIFCMLLLALNILARFPWISLSLLLSNRTEPIVGPGWSPAFLAEQTWRWWHFGESWRN